MVTTTALLSTLIKGKWLGGRSFMDLFKGVKNVWNSLTRRFSYSGQSSNPYESVNDFGGSRTTIPSFIQGGGGVFGSLPKRTRSDLGLDERQLQNAPIEDLMDILIDAHPDVSFALWNFLRIGDSGYTIKVERLKTGKPYPQAERDINELIQRMSLPNMERFEVPRTFDNLVNQLLLSTITRGAAAAEVVMFPGLDDVAFIAPVDPATIEFYFENDRFVPYQDEGGISLDIPTLFYQPLDPRIDDPYGRSPLLGAVNIIMFQLQVLNDIKAVVHNQGYPRFDIKVLEEVLLKRMPIPIRHNEEKKNEWLNARLKEIVDMYNNLNPDDAFVHFDSVEITTAGGSKGGGGAVIDPEKLMNAIDNLIMSGLKTLSTILGRRSHGNTESFAKIEIKMYLKSVQAIQKVVADLLSRVLTFYLNVRGKQGIVKFSFLPVEVRTELEKAQFEQIHLMNCAYKRDQGWIDQDEASILAVGHEAVGEPQGSSSISNKDGEEVGGTPDEKGPDSPTETDEY